MEAVTPAPAPLIAFINPVRLLFALMSSGITAPPPTVRFTMPLLETAVVPVSG